MIIHISDLHFTTKESPEVIDDPDMELEHTGLVQKFIRDNGFDTVCYGHEGSRTHEEDPKALAGIKLHNANNFRDNPADADFIV